MKVLFAVSFLSVASAFSPVPHNIRTVSSLSATTNKDVVSAASVAVGWAIASQAAVAMPMTSNMVSAASMETKKEAAYEKLDFSLPSYGSSNASGFGDGVEAFLGSKNSALTDPGQGEGDKQKEAMRKAEEARKERVKKQKEEMKQREAEAKEREEEKRKEKAGRFASIFE